MENKWLTSLIAISLFITSLVSYAMLQEKEYLLNEIKKTQIQLMDIKVAQSKLEYGAKLPKRDRENYTIILAKELDSINVNLEDISNSFSKFNLWINALANFILPFSVILQFLMLIKQFKKPNPE